MVSTGRKAGSVGLGPAGLNKVFGLWGTVAGLVIWSWALGTSGQGDTAFWSVAAC